MIFWFVSWIAFPFAFLLIGTLTNNKYLRHFLWTFSFRQALIEDSVYWLNVSVCVQLKAYSNFPNQMKKTFFSGEQSFSYILIHSIANVNTYISSQQLITNRLRLNGDRLLKNMKKSKTFKVFGIFDMEFRTFVRNGRKELKQYYRAYLLGKERKSKYVKRFLVVPFPQSSNKTS